MYENNIKLHYVDYVERFVNVVWLKDYQIKKIKETIKNKDEQTKLINEVYSNLRKIKNDFLNNTLNSDEKFKDCIINLRKFITPNKKYDKGSIYYDVKSHPQDYLPCMIHMMKAIESHDLTISNVFPMRNDIISKNITLDTTTLVHLLLTKKYGNKTDYLFKGNLKLNEDRIWNFFFRTERRCFNKPNYSFHHMIETDGVSCSILFVRNDLVGKKKIISNNIEIKEQYIDELEDYTKLKNKKIVAIDPGKQDLLYCVDSDNKDANEFRYTQNSRRKECKIKKYSNLILDFKKEIIDGKTVIEHETELSKFNKKTLIIDEFKKYIQKKDEINNKLFAFYHKYIFRKLKLNGYLNRKKHEQQMINKFKKIFGNSENTIICIGNFEQKQHMKNIEPSKGVGFRKLFRQNNYEVYLVDEHKTSCMCSKCEEGRCEKFIYRENHKPKGNDNHYKDIILVHGALRCKICNAVWNRDVNGATNIWKIAKAAIEEKERPKYLQRDKKAYNSKIVCKQSSVWRLKVQEVDVATENQNLHTQ